MLTPPMRARFGIEQRLNYYPPEDLELIVRRTADVLKVEIDLAGAREIARRSRGTPRVANRLLRRVRDYAQVRPTACITEDVAQAALAAARRRPVRARRHGRAHPEDDHREVRRRPRRRDRRSPPRSARTRARSRRCTSRSSSRTDSCSARRAAAWRRRWRTGISGTRRPPCPASRSCCSELDTGCAPDEPIVGRASRSGRHTRVDPSLVELALAYLRGPGLSIPCMPSHVRKRRTSPCWWSPSDTCRSRVRPARRGGTRPGAWPRSSS